MERAGTDSEAQDARPLPRLRLLIVGIGLIGAACALGAWIFVRGDPPFVVDVWWNELMLSWGSSFMLAFSLTMNFLGGGWFGVFVVPIGVALWLVIARKPWSALYFIAASATSAIVVQLFKHTFGRVRPEEILVISDHGSYPSGHVANAATVALALAVIFPRVWVALAGTAWVLLMALSRTYVHAHWLSDTLGGAMAGAGSALIVAAAFATVLPREPVEWRPFARRPPVDAPLG
ncbi:phosphatase PAP2 family protein [Microbacterium sp. SS28]|uniref:phosphatase PAP2 family protein n=1 Tax=Microbacterium sp. SS28 TaxID=2919948 RepID=UPI001FAA9CFB|nr:phosphatase PAP2 family protein [Microbacterium sp. SS28]